MKTRMFELPATTQKSYYNKALIFTDGDTHILNSYNTMVCRIENGKFIRMWDSYSVTTMKHINDFRKFFDLPTISKKEWENLSVEGN